MDYVRKTFWTVRNIHLARFNAAHIKNIVDKREQMLRGLPYFRKIVRNLFLVVNMLCSKARKTNDGIHRRTNIMAHVVEECRLRAACRISHPKGLLQSFLILFLLAGFLVNTMEASDNLHRIRRRQHKLYLPVFNMVKDIRLEIHIIGILVLQIFKNDFTPSRCVELVPIVFTNKFILNKIQPFIETLNLLPIPDYSRENICTTINIFVHGNGIDIADQVKVFGKALDDRLLLDFLAKNIILICKAERHILGMIGIADFHKLHLAIAIEEVHVHRVKAFAIGKLFPDILNGTRLEHSVLVDSAHKLIDIHGVRQGIFDILLKCFTKRICSRLVHGIRRYLFGIKINVVH